MKEYSEGCLGCPTCVISGGETDNLSTKLLLEQSCQQRAPRPWRAWRRCVPYSRCKVFIGVFIYSALSYNLEFMGKNVKGNELHKKPSDNGECERW